MTLCSSCGSCCWSTSSSSSGGGCSRSRRRSSGCCWRLVGSYLVSVVKHVFAMCKHSILTSQKCLVIEDVSTFAQYTLSEFFTARDTGPVIPSPLISMSFGSVDCVPYNSPSNILRSTPEQNYLYCKNGPVLSFKDLTCPLDGGKWNAHPEWIS